VSGRRDDESGLRDYVQWHKAYDDPDSDLSWRLRTVQQYLHHALDTHSGRIRVLSVCAGEGRDVVGVLAERPDAERVDVRLIELRPALAERARRSAVAAGLTRVEVVVADAGDTDTYVDLVPADVVLMVGIFGNITDEDLRRTIETTPQFCRTGATLLWSRGRQHGDRNDAVRAWFAAAGFVEVDYAARDTGEKPALGAVRYDGQPVALVEGRRMFTFLR